MKKLATIVAGILLVPAIVWAMGSHGGQHNKPPVFGPWLFCVSEGAENFEIEIDGQVFDCAATEEFELSADLRFYIRIPGNYDMLVTPINKNGRGKEIFFALQVVKTRAGLVWEVIPIGYLIEEDPEYIESFSTDLKVITKK